MCPLFCHCDNLFPAHPTIFSSLFSIFLFPLSRTLLPGRLFTRYLADRKHDNFHMTQPLRKTPALLLHGALGSKTQLEPLRVLFSDPEAMSMNFSGHGGLPLDHVEYNLLLFADDVITFLNEKGVEVANIFGYSMGGYVALKLAQLYPQRVNRIFTLGTKFDWTPESAARETALLDPEKITAKVPHFAEALQQRHASEDWEKVLQKTVQMMHALGNGEAMTNEDFAGIPHEVVIGIGSQDNMVSQQESQAVADILPHGRLEVFEGFNHPIEQVDTPRLFQSISAFFNA